MCYHDIPRVASVEINSFAMTSSRLDFTVTVTDDSLHFTVLLLSNGDMFPVSE